MEIAERSSNGRRTAALLAIGLLTACVSFLVLRALSRQADVAWSCMPFQRCSTLGTRQAFIEQVRGWDHWVPPFLALTFAGIVLAASGRRYFFVIPAACLVLVPRAFGGQSQSLAETFWPSQVTGAAAEAALATIGGAIVADRYGRSRAPRPRPWDVAALGVCATGLAVILWLRSVIDNQPLAGSSTAILVALLAFGAGTGMRRPWFPWAHIGVALLLSEGNAGQWWWREPASWTRAIPFLAVVFLGTLREPLGNWLARLDRRPLEALLAFELVNTADAILTGIGVARGNIVEANPVARFIGMPIKVIVGGVAGWLLFRWRPRLLLLPIIALLGVLTYHVGGLWTHV